MKPCVKKQDHYFKLLINKNLKKLIEHITTPKLYAENKFYLSRLLIKAKYYAAFCQKQSKPSP